MSLTEVIFEQNSAMNKYQTHVCVLPCFVTGNNVEMILQAYFPDLCVAGFVTRWEGRPRGVFQYLLRTIIERSKGVDSMATLQVGDYY